MGINDPVETTEFPIDKFTYNNLTYLLEDYNFFIAFYGTTDYEEIGGAYTDNKLIFCYDDTSGIFGSLGTHTSNGPFTFYSINNTEIISMSVNNNDQWSQGGQTIPALPSYGTAQDGKILGVNSSGVLTWRDDNDTKNTAGSTQSTSKLFLVGATSQTANAQTFSHSKVYATNGTLYSNNAAVLVDGYNSSSTVSITPTTTNVYSISSVGNLTMAIDENDDKKLNITFTAPERSQVTNLWQGTVQSATAAAQSFTGSSVKITT